MSAVINHRNIFFGGLAPKVKGIKAKINKWNLIKLKSFDTTKETINRKDNYELGENTCIYTIKELYFKYEMNSYRSIRRK